MIEPSSLKDVTDIVPQELKNVSTSFFIDKNKELFKLKFESNEAKRRWRKENSDRRWNELAHDLEKKESEKNEQQLLEAVSKSRLIRAKLNPPSKETEKMTIGMSNEEWEQQINEYAEEMEIPMNTSFDAEEANLDIQLAIQKDIQEMIMQHKNKIANRFKVYKTLGKIKEILKILRNLRLWKHPKNGRNVGKRIQKALKLAKSGNKRKTAADMDLNELEIQMSIMQEITRLNTL